MIIVLHVPQNKLIENQWNYYPQITVWKCLNKIRVDYI